MKTMREIKEDWKMISQIGKEILSRFSCVRYVDGRKDQILFKINEKQYLGVLRGKNKNLKLGRSEQQNKKIAQKVVMAGDAKLV